MLKLSLLNVLVILGVVSADPCLDIKRCVKDITGIKLASKGSGMTDEKYCDAVVEMFQGEAGIEKICDAAALIGKKRRKLGRQRHDPKSFQWYDSAGDGDGEKTLFGKTITRDPDRGHLFGNYIPTPQCLAFSPEYADLSGTLTPYDLLVEPVEEEFLLEGKLKRSDVDAYAMLKESWEIVLLAAAQASGTPDSESVTAVMLAEIEVVLDAIDTHDDRIDSAEIEAAFNNTDVILNHTCNILGQLDQFGEEMEGTLEFIEKKLDELEYAVRAIYNKLENIEYLLTRR